MSRLNWTRNKQRQQMHRQGTEGVHGDDQPIAVPPIRPRRRRLSKAELRAIADEAFRLLPVTKRG